MIKYRLWKLTSKLNILSRESGDSSWEGDMKHCQNHGRILLPKEVFETVPETIKLRIDKELLNEIQTLSTTDKEIQEMQKKKESGNTSDGVIILGLCKEDSGMLIYDSLIWIHDNNDVRLRILRDHHDVQAI